MGRQNAVFNIVEGAQRPFMIFRIQGVEESDFDSITLELRRSDGKLITRTAVVTDPGAPGTRIPLAFHFEWEPGDIIAGTHEADLVLIVEGEPLRLPKQVPITVVARKKA